MKKIIITYLILLSMTAIAQNTKTLEGYYNLSEFEMAARLFLLDNNTFYYSAIFGSVDLEIYGKYTIKGDLLHFYPQEDQMQTFILYGRENKKLKDAIELNYYKPEGSYRSLVVFGADKQWIKRPIEQADNDEIKIVIKQQHITTLKIGYPTYFDRVGQFFQVTNVTSAKIPKGNNDFVMSYNRYADMRQQFSKKPILLKGDALVNGKKTRQKQPLQEGEREKIITFLNEHKMFESRIESNGNTFQSILLKDVDSKPKLKINKNGALEELITYTQNGKKDTNGHYYYENKKLKQLLTYKNNIRKGNWKTYYENGQLEETGNYKNGLKESKWISYYTNGQERSIENYKEEQRQGEQKSFFPNGQLEERGNYKNDKKEGEWKIYYKNGKTKEIENYKNGEINGAYKSYYENGQLKEVSEKKGYTNIGKYEAYKEDGTIKRSGSYNKEGKQEGEWKTNDWNSTVGSYANGERIGEHKTFFKGGKIERIEIYNDTGNSFKGYYKNGQLEEIGKYKNGKPSGEWISYHENGKIESQEEYKNGKIIGVLKNYYKNGKVEAFYTYKNDKRNGASKRYYETGELFEDSYYENGDKTGIQKIYYKTGQLREIGEVDDRGYISEYKRYYESGQLQSIGMYSAYNYPNSEYQRKMGEWKHYHENGQLSWIVSYKKGKPIGESKKYSENGELLSTASFKNGELIGDWKYYPKKYTTYYDNGEIKETGAKLDGDFFGELKHYFESGKLAGLHMYDNFGRANGEWKHYHENGQVKTIRLWRFDKLKEVISCFDNYGVALDKGTFKDGNGAVNNYDANGKVTIADYLYGKEINWNDSSRLNSLAWTVYENEDDKEKLEKAIKMVKHSIKLEKTYYNTDTYAALLYKTGNYKQAIEIANQAIAIAKKDKIDFKTTIQLIEEINKKIN